MTSLHHFIAALSLVVAGSAAAETYEGVHPLTTERARADVVAEAVVAAHSPDPYAEGASSGVAPMLQFPTSRRLVQAEAVKTAQAPNQNLDAKAFFNSEIPPQYNNSAVNTRMARDADGAANEASRS